MDSMYSRRQTLIPWVWRLILFTSLTAIGILLYHGLVILLSYLTGPIGFPVAETAATLVLSLLLMFFAGYCRDILQVRLFRRKITAHNLIPRMRDEIAQCRDVFELAQRVLGIVQHELNVDDLQLTFYYDQPFALEVTHLRRTGEHMQRVIARVREDEPDSQSDEEDVLTPLTAGHTEVLTHRDRLVGLLLLGSQKNRKSWSPRDLELIAEVSPVIASGADQVMMVRHINETNQRLFESDKLISIGQLASGIAHEIRNPLTSIRMNLQGLNRRAKLSDKDKQRVQISLDEINRLDDIISEIMQFARRTKLEVAPVKAEALIKTAIGMARSELEQRNIEIVTRFQKGLPVIRADENRLIRVIINLLINAAQAMGKGGRITVTAEPFGTGVEIMVIDQGPGIPKELRRDIFNPFFTTKADGTGLGLANALKFVQEHGGELDFTTEEGEGTTFSLRLPPSPPVHLDDPSALRVLPT